MCWSMACRAARSSGGWGLVGGQQWAEQPVVQFGVEDRGLDPLGGQDVAVGAPDPGDEPGEPEPPQVVGHLAGCVGVCSSPVIKARRLSGIRTWTPGSIPSTGSTQTTQPKITGKATRCHSR